jgi:hypothetical protein
MERETESAEANNKRPLSKLEEKKASLIKKISFLSRMDEEYVVKAVNGNYTLESELFKDRTFSLGDYTAADLQFIKSVKRYITTNAIYLLPQFEKQYFKRDVAYLGVKKTAVGTHYDGLMEVDIDEAYWKTARLLEIIPQEIYEKGQKAAVCPECHGDSFEETSHACKGCGTIAPMPTSKKTRLTALGTLAKKIKIYRLKGRQLIKESVESDPLLENLWFTICKRIGDIMHEVARSLGDDYIFYWVDGIYMKRTPESVQKAVEIFNHYGYNAKTKPIDSIDFNEDGFVVWDTPKEKREFNYPHYTKDRKRDFVEAENIKELAQKVFVQNYDVLGAIENKYG